MLFFFFCAYYCIDLHEHTTSAKQRQMKAPFHFKSKQKLADDSKGYDNRPEALTLCSPSFYIGSFKRCLKHIRQPFPESEIL